MLAWTLNTHTQASNLSFQPNYKLQLFRLLNISSESTLWHRKSMRKSVERILGYVYRKWPGSTVISRVQHVLFICTWFHYYPTSAHLFHPLNTAIKSFFVCYFPQMIHTIQPSTTKLPKILAFRLTLSIVSTAILNIFSVHAKWMIKLFSHLIALHLIDAIQCWFCLSLYLIDTMRNFHVICCGKCPHD